MKNSNNKISQFEDEEDEGKVGTLGFFTKEIVNYERDQVEKNLKFLGLLIFVNKIKEKTF